MSNDPAVIAALSRYSSAEHSVRDDIQKNKSVFDNHERLVGSLIDARNALEDAAIASADPDAVTVTDNGEFRATVTPQNQVVIDPDQLRASHGKLITDELLSVLIKTVKRPPRVSVSTTPGARV